MTARRLLAVAVAVALVATGACALAFFRDTGTASAAGSVGTVNAPSGVTVAQSAAAVQVSWAAATTGTGGAVEGYRVRRADGTTVCGGTTPVTGLSCTDSSPRTDAGQTYTVTAVYRGFTASATSAAYTTLVAPTLTTSPSSTSADANPSFAWTGSGGTYECRLDGGSYSACTSAKVYAALADGAHTFDVRVVQGTSNGPAQSFAWTIDRTAPTITAKPTNPSADTAPSFSFTHPRGSYTFECRLDGGTYAACTSAKAYSGVTNGSHTFDVRAVDAAGQPTTFSTYTWVVSNVPPSQVITLASGATGAFLAGTRLFLAGSGASFRLTDTVTATPRAAQSATFPAPSAVNITHAAETVSTPAGGPFTSSAFTKAAGDVTAPGGGPATYAVTATNDLGTTATTTLDLVADANPPTGAALTVNGTAATSGAASTSTTAATTFAIGARTDATDTESGLRSSTLTVRSAALTDSWSNGVHSTTCGAAGSGGPFTTATTITGTAQPSGFTTNACYIYTLTATDNVGNASSVSTTVKVPAASYLYWANAGTHKFGSANLDTPGQATQILGSAPPDSGIAVDGAYLYWTDTANNRIGRAKLDGSSPNLDFMTGVSSPVAVAVNGTHLFWASKGGSQIGRANIDGTGRNASFISTLISVGVGTDSYGLALDSGHIYWSGYALTNLLGGEIRRANLDGTGSTQIASGINQAYGVAVDGSKVYWTSRAGNTIGRANLDGSNSTASFITGASAPQGVAVDAGHVYWTNATTNTIGRADIGGANANQSFVTGASTPFGIAVGAG